MKKLFSTLLFCWAALCAQNVAAQYVTIPDANFRNALKVKYPTCFNADSQLDTTCALILTDTLLNVSVKNIANLEGVRYFKNLKELNCYGNLLTSLPPLPDSLKTLICYTNALTSLTTLPSTLTYLHYANNMVDSLPALPAGLEYLNCSNNSMNSLTELPPMLKHLYCSDNSLPSLPAVLPSSLNTLYFPNNLVENLPVLPSQLKILHCANNLLQELQNFPASLSALYCHGNPIYCLPFLPSGMQVISLSNTNITCIPNKPVNMPSSFPICNPINNIAQCMTFPMFSGYVFYDANGNGIKDSSEIGMANIAVKISANNKVFTDANGFYSITVPDTGYFVATVVTPQYFIVQDSAITAHFTAFGQISATDFALTTSNPFRDLSTHLESYQRARPGFMLNFKLTYRNQGTVPTNAVAKFVKPFLYTTAIVSEPNYTVSGDTLIWNLGTLGIGEIKSIVVHGTVSTAAVLGSVLSFQSLLNNNDTLDYNLADNVSTINLTVQGSLDPNDKQARPAISPAQIAAGEYIDYTIRFQNTGTDTAFTVVIADTLESNLQANTLEMLASSHNVRTSVKGNIVYFEHLNILLPDSNVNEKASHGFVSFRIKPQTNLALGATVSNKAAIYFDYNAPVITNTAITKVQNPTGIFDKINKTVSVYPNPVNKGVLYVPNMAGASATLTSLEGKELRNWSAIGESVSLEGIAQGMYLLKVTQKGETRTAKVMVK
ncbi:conserved repeat domain-containing protein/Por secretion system C-terminal sorting domain-containing protein [Flexibacter flexilis DSM 6793]|uniref:Conserved repeat domain-containing protein/Por secretion system C-terminal sorting domain-containing protein n=1 Tax=Flexibacter flexilis DSM 6793 TaxID=927664 RepID=A0A1I1L6Q9_9BACT|nr:T9SS type A sorting domain-containing protein [Flexibacter flexilis]SFC66688.1 conserved repeat domain-containing protein/Por secretion system C-terminal sorting domain-containing protein [Flexibacter flexilis DSM 6793]